MVEITAFGKVLKNVLKMVEKYDKKLMKINTYIV